MATAAWRADRSTPIVIATILDPVELEFVKSLARPGTRVTGVTIMNNELTAKRLQLLMETVPGLKRVGVMVDEAMRDACKQEMDAMNAAGKKLGLTLVYVHVDRTEAIDAAFRKLAKGINPNDRKAEERARMQKITDYLLKAGGVRKSAKVTPLPIRRQAG